MGLPRIQYNSINVDFKRHFNDANVYPEEMKTENLTTSGIKETIDYYEEWKINCIRERLSAEEIVQLREWYRYVKAGNEFKLWIDRNLGIYCAFDGKSAKTNNELSPTFARTGVANYIDPSTGFVTEVAENVARFPAGKFGRGLLLEGAATNICLYSDDFNDATWTKTNVTIASNTAHTLDPAGGNVADKATSTAANAILAQTIATAIGTNDGTFSVWIKGRNPAADDIKIRIKDSTDTELAVETISTTVEWQRYAVTFNNSGSNANNWKVEIEIVNNTKVFYVFGAQLETSLMMTSYIETTAASATRNAETLYYDITDGLEIARTQGTIAFWFYNLWPENEVTLQRVLLEAATSGGDIVFRIEKEGTTQHLYFIAENADGSGSTASADVDLAQTTWHHVAVTWDFTNAADCMRLYFDGVLVDNAITALQAPAIPDKIYLGSTAAPADYGYSIFDELIVLTERKETSWILSLYNSQFAKGLQRNYFPSVMLDDNRFNPILHRGGNKFDFELNVKEVLT